jgi:hypothetical protein
MFWLNLGFQINIIGKQNIQDSGFKKAYHRMHDGLRLLWQPQILSP